MTPIFDGINIKVFCRYIYTSVDDKRDDHGFPIVNFPWLSGDIPSLLNRYVVRRGEFRSILASGLIAKNCVLGGGGFRNDSDGNFPLPLSTLSFTKGLVFVYSYFLIICIANVSQIYMRTFPLQQGSPPYKRWQQTPKHIRMSGRWRYQMPTSVFTTCQ